MPKSTTTAPPDPLRQRILQTATELFGQQGVDSTSMREIADALGITKAAIYYHFENKDQLHYEIQLSLMAGVLDQLRAVAASDLGAAEKIERVVAVNLQSIAENRGAFTVLLRESGNLALPHWAALTEMRDEYRHLVEGVIEEGVKAKAFAVDDVGVAALALLGMCNWSYTWISPGGRMPIDAIAKQFAGIFIAGVRAG